MYKRINWNFVQHQIILKTRDKPQRCRVMRRTTKVEIEEMYSNVFHILLVKQSFQEVVAGHINGVVVRIVRTGEYALALTRAKNHSITLWKYFQKNFYIFVICLFILQLRTCEVHHKSILKFNYYSAWYNHINENKNGDDTFTICMLLS